MKNRVLNARLDVTNDTLKQMIATGEAEIYIANQVAVTCKSLLEGMEGTTMRGLGIHIQLVGVENEKTK